MFRLALSVHAWAFLVAAFFVNVSSASAAEPYDLLIRNGRIVDGAGNPWFRADVAIRGDRIAAIGKLDAASARRTIDAAGLIVAPGFIDIHSHSDFRLLEDGNAQSKIRQGVTTEVLGEGRSAGPYQGKLEPRNVLVNGEEVPITSLADYFKIVQRVGISTNICSYVGVNNVWQSVMGSGFERPSPEQLRAMQRLVEEEMRAGAWGLSSQVMMPPGSLANTDDLVALCKAVAPFGGIYSTHIRNEGTGVFDAVKEAIAVGERAGVGVDIIHLKIADQKYWGRMGEVIELIEQARRRGVNVQANVYPYTRGNNNLDSIIPPWAHEGGRGEMLRRLQDQKLRPRLKRDIRNGLPGWYNHFTAVGGDWSRMLVSDNNQYQGLTMDRVMSLRTQGKTDPDLLDEMFDLLIEEDGSVATVYAHHEEQDMNLALKQHWCSVGSDGSAFATEGPLRKGNPHPRNFGTFPRLLGRYVRQTKLLRLEDAVRKITSLNAAKIGLRRRGQLQPGFYADVTVFDANKIIDQATYSDPFQYNLGVEFVVVNGQLVLEGNRHTGARPGRALLRGSKHDAPPASPAVKKGAKLEQANTAADNDQCALAADSASVSFSATETAGVRRRNDVVSGRYKFQKPLAPGQRFRMMSDGKALSCQLVEQKNSAGQVVALAFDFIDHFAPFQSKTYQLAFGPDVAPHREPKNGLRLSQDDGVFRVANRDHLVWTVRKDLQGLLKFLLKPNPESVADDSAGLTFTTADGVKHLLSARKPTSVTVTRSGPIACGLKFQYANWPPGAASTVDMQFVRTKSWVIVDWKVQRTDKTGTASDPQPSDNQSLKPLNERTVTQMAAELQLTHTGREKLIDFAGGDFVYTTVAKGQRAVLESEHRNVSRPWSVLRGKPESLEALVVAPRNERPDAFGGWAHVIGDKRCLALAMLDFGQTARDRIEFDWDGRLSLNRNFRNGDSSAARRLRFGLHFVGVPVHIGARTSPQAMRSPLKISWR